MIRAHVLHVPGVDPARDEIVARQQADPDLDVCLHEDPKRNGPLPTWIKAMRCSMDDGQDWTLILQDDVLPLEGWAEHFEQATRHAPIPLMALTHLGGYGAGVLKRGGAYGKGRSLIWGAAVTIQSEHVEPCLRAAIRFHHATGYPHDDGVVSLYGKLIGTGTAMTARALFDLAEVTSLLGHPTKGVVPATTIVNSDGPSYEGSPVIPVSRGDRAKFYERYARYVLAQGGAERG